MLQSLPQDALESVRVAQRDGRIYGLRGCQLGCSDTMRRRFVEGIRVTSGCCRGIQVVEGEEIQWVWATGVHWPLLPQPPLCSIQGQRWNRQHPNSCPWYLFPEREAVESCPSFRHGRS